MTAWTDLIGQPVVHRIGWVLLHFLWQGTVIATVWSIVRVLLRTCEAKTRYAVACGLLGMMVMAPIITLVWLEPSSATRPGVVSNAVSGLSALSTADPMVDSWIVPAIGERVLAGIEQGLSWLVAVWCLGVSALSVRLLRGYWSVRSVATRQARPMDAAWRDRLTELRRRLRVSRPVLLFESVLIEVPAVVGWFRPMILVPASSLSGLTPAQLELILAHELAHIRRHDHWVNLVQVLVETLLFYHPAVWWISRDIRAERELCCDDLAVAACGNPLAYARALTTLEGLRRAPVPLVVGAGDGSLIDRIRHIVGPSGSTATDWRRATGSALLAVGMLLFVAGIGCLIFSPRQFRAVCRIARVDPGAPANEMGSLRVSAEPLPPDPYFIATAFEKMRSKRVLYRVINELGLEERWRDQHGVALKPAQAYEMLRRRVDFRQFRNTGLFEIRVSSDSPVRPAGEAAEIANKIAEVYIATRDDWGNGSRVRGLKVLEQELEGENQQLREAQDRVDKLRPEFHITEVSEGSTSIGTEPESVRRIEAERATVQSSYGGIVNLLTQIKAMRAATDSESAFRQGLLSAHPDADLSKLLQDLWATEASLASECVSKGPEHPDCRALSARRTQLEKTIGERIEGMLRGLEVRAAALKTQCESLDRALAEARQREAEQSSQYRNYFLAKRDLENQQKVRDAILLRKLQETVDLQIPPSKPKWEVVDPAEPALRPVGARGGLGLGLCAAGLITSLSGLMVRGSARPPKLHPS